MSDDRSRIFAAIREALQPLQSAGKASPYPDYEVGQLTSLPRLGAEESWQAFARNLAAVNGHAYEKIEECAAFLQEHGVTEGYCDPELIDRLREGLGSAFTLHPEFDRASLERYSFGITKASGIIVESGTIILKDRGTSNRLGALAPWVHVAVLTEEAPIFSTMSEALAELGDDPNVIWVTGPSKTADVEGILIEGVHGPGQQLCLHLS
ncbi:MAG: hypothetical protein E1N59_170 [Puniceicoccaceae bacterium 5H]|nr:MAG: hypothetical protein E1N59_170 [Puniceicoccaceae bacterium 5H]